MPVAHPWNQGHVAQRLKAHHDELPHDQQKVRPLHCKALQLPTLHTHDRQTHVNTRHPGQHHGHEAYLQSVLHQGIGANEACETQLVDVEGKDIQEGEGPCQRIWPIRLHLVHNAHALKQVQPNLNDAEDRESQGGSSGRADLQLGKAAEGHKSQADTQNEDPGSPDPSWARLALIVLPIFVGTACGTSNRNPTASAGSRRTTRAMHIRVALED
mmetsp:Transcript_25024/g.59502  ORF Transcript_25024/g.59502 Transcript_25024/m.59502 type:complete len:214 (-) Transcript_25024:584-1225(-)